MSNSPYTSNQCGITKESNNIKSEKMLPQCFIAYYFPKWNSLTSLLHLNHLKPWTCSTCNHKWMLFLWIVTSPNCFLPRAKLFRSKWSRNFLSFQSTSVHPTRYGGVEIVVDFFQSKCFCIVFCRLLFALLMFVF